MTDYQRFDELVSSAVRASSVINKVDILKNALDLYHGKVLPSADGEHWLIQFSTKYQEKQILTLNTVKKDTYRIKEQLTISGTKESSLRF